jgi:hypothetical protein
MQAFIMLGALVVGAGDAEPGLTRQEIRLPLPSVWVLEWTGFDGTRARPGGELRLGRTGGTLKAGGTTLNVRAYQLDPGARHARIRLTFQWGATGRMVEYIGIYRFDGVRLLLSICNPQRGWPGDFVTRPGDGHTVLVFKRSGPVAAR